MTLYLVVEEGRAGARQATDAPALSSHAEAPQALEACRCGHLWVGEEAAILSKLATFVWRECLLLRTVGWLACAGTNRPSRARSILALQFELRLPS